jgi:Cu/Ag efflux protein CusF
MTILAALIGLAGATAIAARQTVTKADLVTATATIQAIDSATRKVTLRTEDGEEDAFVAPPEMTRFSELKVGDRVRLSYYASVVFQVRKPGEAPTGTAAVDAAFERAKSGLPAGLLSAQQKQTVTVKQVDLSEPSLTVTTADGRVVTRKIQDKTKIEAIKPGDQIDITYTEALLASIERVP